MELNNHSKGLGIKSLAIRRRADALLFLRVPRMARS